MHTFVGALCIIVPAMRGAQAALPDAHGPASRPTTAPASAPPRTNDPEGAQIRNQINGAMVAGRTEPLVLRVLQRRDKDDRQKALDELLGQIRNRQGQQKAFAIVYMSSLRDVPFDRTAFLAEVRQALADPQAVVRAAALCAIRPAGGDSTDIGPVVALANDADGGVRLYVARALYALTDAEHLPTVQPAIELLLNDPWEEVVHATIQALWGSHPLSPATEARLVELSHDPKLGSDAVYYALSTEPFKGLATCNRLIELLEDPLSTHRSRAAWGLSHFEVRPDARDIVVAALIRELDEDLDANIRADCVYGLGTHGGEAALAKLKETANSDESETIRKAAQQALARLARGR